jgi:hypothetical protein
LEDISPLTEVATAHQEALQVLTFAWLNGMHHHQDKSSLQTSIDQAIQSLAVAFKSTDAVTFLNFLGYFLRNADPEVGVITLQDREVSLHRGRLFPGNQNGYHLSSHSFGTWSQVAQHPKPGQRIQISLRASSMCTPCIPPIYCSRPQIQEKSHSHIF